MRTLSRSEATTTGSERDEDVERKSDEVVLLELRDMYRSSDEERSDEITKDRLIELAKSPRMHRSPCSVVLLSLRACIALARACITFAPRLKSTLN